jgi:hypothetical protein
MSSFNQNMLFAICLFVLAQSCGQRHPHPIVQASHADTVAVSQKALPKADHDDTLHVDVGKPQILAYSLSQPEYDTMSDKLRSEYDEGYSDFYEDVLEYDKAGHPGISLSQTGSPLIVVGDSLIDRRILDHNDQYGFIFVSGSGKVKVFQGMLSEADIRREAKSFLVMK